MKSQRLITRAMTQAMTRASVLLAVAAVLLTALFPVSPVAALEKIISFDSEIWIQKNGSLTVRETITVVAEGNQIKRGIYRDFPNLYTSKRGVRTTTTFDVQSVHRDGQPDNWFTESQSNGVRLYIGNKDVLLKSGRYVYEITYNTDRQLGHFDDFDELYWNVTGNGWVFEMDRVTAKIHLPDGARVLEHAGYTGAFGATGTDFTYTQPSDTQVWFETNRILRANEGLTVAVSWPIGFVDRPSASELAFKKLRQYGAEISGIIGIALILLYYMIVWFRVGRDPKRGTIYPLYGPPDGVSPAAARFVSRMGFDNKNFTSAIVNLAVKGHLTIGQSRNKIYTLRETGETVDFSPGEQAMVGKLFTGSKGEIKLKQSNHRKLSGARSALKTSLKGDYEAKYFVKNIAYFVPGVGLSAVVVLTMMLFSIEPIASGFLCVWLTVWSFAVTALIWKVRTAWRAVFAEGGLASMLGAAFLTFFSLPFIGGWFVGASALAMTVSFAGVALIVVITGLNGLFYHLLKAPTLLGRQLLDQLEGFKLFLTVAEKDRMNLLNPPERTPELFEKFLPYALALEVEHEWAENFAGVLENIKDPDTGRTRTYSPNWYSGAGFDGNLNTMTSTLSDSLSNAISSAATAPGSSGSSGSSGGGSSGGGGGGGGGGGW